MVANRSYAELDRDSAQIRQQLLNLGVQENHRIAICAAKDYQSYSALLAIILSDACYIPIDHLTPVTRIESILADSRAEGIVGEKTIIAMLASNRVNAQYHPIENTELAYLRLGLESERTEEESNLAYILYTSGSTGTPKGVLITQQNALSFISWAVTAFDFDTDDVFSSVAPFHFDLSIFDIFVSVYHGAKLVLFSDRHIRNPMQLAQLIEQRGISVWYSTPITLLLLNQYGKMHKYSHRSVRKVLYAGELFPVNALKAIRAKWHQADFYNLYGPTETNVCTWTQIGKLVTEDHDSSIIGQSCQHLASSILVDKRVLVPEAGLEGELLISGAAVSPGYLYDHQLTASKYILDEQGTRWHRTGDQVYVTEQLDFKYLGRLDRMIKKRGYRIELDEIQTTIEQYPQVIRAGVISKSTQAGSSMIIAFYEIEQDETGQARHNEQEILAHTKKRLPDYMWPDHWQRLDSLPLTSTAKIDFTQLAKHCE